MPALIHGVAAHGDVPVITTIQRWGAYGQDTAAAIESSAIYLCISWRDVILCPLLWEYLAPDRVLKECYVFRVHGVAPMLRFHIGATLAPASIAGNTRPVSARYESIRTDTPVVV